MSTRPTSLAQRELLDAASTRRRLRRLAEVDEMLVAAQWAVLHGEPQDPRDPMSQPGGDGTPDVREYCLAELAMAQETHHLTARSLIADTLDLIHRLPRTWALVAAGRCEPWVARRVASMSRPLLAGTVGVVDTAVARAIEGHAPSTVFSIARAKIIEADPETHAAERARIRHERYVRLSRADEHGYRHVIARVTAGDATWIDALVDRVADILAQTHGHDHNHDELRSLALGWLARPVDLLALLLQHTEPGDHPDGDPDTQPRTDSCTDPESGEDSPEDLDHADVTVQPVLDLRDRRRSDAYEHPEPTKDHVWTQTGGDAFPYSPRTATRDRVDFDHTTPYDPTGPPGQTGPHNSGPLRRTHHNWKTHGHYNCRTAGPGRHLWQTHHGRTLLVDHHGTRRLTDPEADLILTTPPGLETYLPRFELVLAGTPTYLPEGIAAVRQPP